MSEPLLDPLNDRVVSEKTPPPHMPLQSEVLFPQGPQKPPNYKLLKCHFRDEGRITKSDALIIIAQALEIFKREKNLIEINSAVTVVGDIHGQFYDFLKILDLIGEISNNKFLFLGDYVDRGFFSVEVILTLYSLKINYPHNIFMIRGNHECRQMTSYFNFRAECLYKYDAEFYDLICDSFNTLPLACIINKKFLAVHAGLSPELVSLDNLNKANRFVEPPSSGLICDILWSDPVENDSGDLEEKYKINEVRGCSYIFGKTAAEVFLKRNKLLTIIRAHQVQVEGYKLHRWGNPSFPMVITIFSAPNYCDMYDNKAALIRFDDSTLNIQQFSCNEHPYILPDFQDLFVWSIPFVIEKILALLHQILTQDKNMAINPINSGEKVKELEKSVKHTKVEVMRNKVKALSKMMRLFKTLREEKELILELKGLCPGQKIPQGLIQLGKKALEGAISSFNRAKEWDISNEKRPESE